MAQDYLPFMGILIVYSLEALLFLEQRFERTDALPISEREIQNIRWLPDVCCILSINCFTWRLK